MDFVFAVNDPLDWHRENMRLNPRHYSSLRLLGPAFIESTQMGWGAQVYYNTLVPTHAGVRTSLCVVGCHKPRQGRTK